MSASVCTRKLLSCFKKKFHNIRQNQNRTSYIVLLPEVDPELADKLYFNFQEDLPVFNGLTAEKLDMIMGKQLLEHECVIRDLDRQLLNNPEQCPDLFDDVLHPIEKSQLSFSKIFGVIRTLYLSDSKLMPPPIFFNLDRRVSSADSIKFNCINIYNACKAYDKSKLTEEQSRLLDQYLLEGELNAFNMPEREQNLTTCRYHQLANEAMLFRMRVEHARSEFYLTFNNPIVVRDFPSDLKKMISDPGIDPECGPWTVRLNYEAGEKFLEYCPDREMRWHVWQAEQKAASNAEDNRDIANSVGVEKIRSFRAQLAEYLGLDNYMEISLKTKMVKNKEEITNTLGTYLKVAKEAQMNEIVTLQNFADSRGFEYPIQIWDVSYWSRKHKMTLFNFENELWRTYLPLEKVVDGLFALCKRLFGVRFEECKDADVWHPEVKFYKVYEADNDKPVAGFYFDPYRRDTKIMLDAERAYYVPIRESSRIGKISLPITSFIMNCRRPELENGIPSLLSFNEVKNLFGMFGANLQHLLCKSTYSTLSGLNFVELDASPLVPKFMVNWLYDPMTFDSIHGHYATGDKLKNLNMPGLKKYIAGYNLCVQLYKAHLDIKMHETHTKFWSHIADELWDAHFVFPLSNYQSDPCRYVDIFCNANMGGSYYGKIWGEMLAADVFNAFTEKNADLSSVGARFKDTFLTFGGSVHASEVFRRFRGRDPCPEVLLQSLGLSETKVEPVEEEKVVERPLIVV